jgi:hypothetical protein
MCVFAPLLKDEAGNLKINRRKSTEKIDGIVALAIAVGRWMAVPAEFERARSTAPGCRSGRGSITMGIFHRTRCRSIGFVSYGIRHHPCCLY